MEMDVLHFQDSYMFFLFRISQKNLEFPGIDKQSVPYGTLANEGETSGRYQMFTNRDERRLNSDTEDTEDTEEQFTPAHKKRTSGQAALKAPNNKRRGAVVVGPEEPLISDLQPGKQTLDFIKSYRQCIDKIRAYVDKLVNYVKDHIYRAYDGLQISAHLLSRLAAVQDVLKLNSGTELLHAFQSARAELSSTGPAPFDQFVSLIPQDKRGDVLRGGRGRWTYDYVMQEIDHLIQMSSRMSPDMSSRMSAWFFPPAIAPTFS